MTNIAYHTIVSNSTAPEIIRKAMIERYYSINCNATAVAREYGTKRQTVTKWVHRFEKDGIIGLKDYSRTPHTEPARKKSKEVEDMIIALVKKKQYRIGQDRVQLELPHAMHCSTATINRIMHVYDLIKKRRKKHQRKKQCTKHKKTLRALRNWQVDVKELRDIPNIIALVTGGIIPNFQYTARDQLTGTMFICYGWEHSLINSVRFVSALFEHLKKFGIHPGEITVQTDNGSEFIGSIFARKDSGFTSLIEQVYHGKHITIPIGKKEYQGVVESSHGRIEYELYDVETFHSLNMFLSKAYTYILYWNLDRKKIADKKSPIMLIKEKCGIFDTLIGDFKPFILDEVKTLAYHYQWQSVPYVSDEVIR